MNKNLHFDLKFYKQWWWHILGNLFGFNSATVGGTSVNTLESTYNNRSSTESSRTMDSTNASITTPSVMTPSAKPKRFPLFSVAGLFGIIEEKFK